VTITYRPITVDEAPAFFLTQGKGFGHDMRPESLDRSTRLGNFARSTAAFEGDEIVGTAGIWDFDLTVPGGSLPTAGVTWVSVKPTHRRRGILTSMMRIQIDAIHEHGEPIAALWASEAPIYGRFGYGLAAEGADFHIVRSYASLRHTVPWAGCCRFVSRDEALAGWPVVYEAVRKTIPGMISRSPDWWAYRHLPEQESPRPPFSGSFRVQYQEDGAVLGYVRYRVNEQYAEGYPTSTLFVVELIAATDAAYSALWSYVFGVDLIATIACDWGRVDEPLLHMLEDPRRLVRRTQDTLWVRIINVASALEARRYAVEGRLVVRVKDPYCPWNEGTYVLAGGPAGATCTRSPATPDVEVDATALGAVYLGGQRLQSLARAGRVSGSPEALRRADALFAWDPAPWIPEIF
jgi:predicted acetyltransferase